MPQPIVGDTLIDKNDKELIRMAIKSLKEYQYYLAKLPEKQWLALSYSNKVIWREIEVQQEFLEEIVKNGYIPEMDD